MTDAMCACGEPLHYSSAEMRELVDSMIELAGGDPLIEVVTGGKRWRVPRHYIALHGVPPSWEMPALALRHGFEEIPQPG